MGSEQNNRHPARAVVLLSGGLDSATALAVAQDEGFRCACLTFDYGQRHRAELRAAARIAEAMGVTSRVVVPLDLRVFGGSALTDDAIEVPKWRAHEAMLSGIPQTYVPARNLVFLSIAAAYAESIGATDIVVGVNAVDYSGYPDCRPKFIEAFEHAATLATRAGVEGRPFRVHAPLMRLSKVEIIRLGTRLGVDYGLTHSCYDPTPGGEACAGCDACLLRARGFEEAGIEDPTLYAPASGNGQRSAGSGERE